MRRHPYRGRHRRAPQRRPGPAPLLLATSLSLAAVASLGVPAAGDDGGTATLAAEARARLAGVEAAARAGEAAEVLARAERRAAMAAAAVAQRRELARLEAEQAARAAVARKAEAARAARAAAERARPTWVKPVKSYRLSSPFGVRKDPFGRGHRMHNGLDFAADTGTPVRALGAGTVVAAGPAGGYGIQVTVRHRDGTESSYAHLSKILVAGGKVRAGEAIGEVGSTGNSTGPHLHLEIRVDDVPQDPAAWLRDKGVEV